MSVVYLSIGALSEHFKQLELRRVCFFTALLHMVADVDFFQYAVILKGRGQKLQFTVCVLYSKRGGTQTLIIHETVVSE